MDYRDIRHVIDAPSWTDRQEQILVEPYTYLTQNPGKEIRTKLIDAFNVWLQVPEEDLDVIRRVVRMLHGGSLLMDDVEDDSLLRRGMPVAHKIYGVPQTINAANYVYFLAYQELFRFRRRDSEVSSRGDAKGKASETTKGLDEVITEELLNLHRGQGLDLFWRDSLTCPTEEEYLHMVLGKTGGLFRIAIKLMMDRSQSDVDYVPLVNLISILFQIRDDYMNLQSTEYAGNKGYCEDLTEGKFSFPVVHAVRADTGSREILNILQKRTDSYSLKSRAVDIMRDRTKSFDYTRGVLHELESQVRDEIKRLGGNKPLEAIVDALSLGDGAVTAATP